MTTDAEDRRKRWELKQENLGLERTQVRVPSDKKALIQQVAAAIRSGCEILIAPGHLETRIDNMSGIDAAWTLESLQTALKKSELLEKTEFAIDEIAGATPVLRVRQEHLGDLDTFISINGEQIVSSVLLWPRDQQDEPEKFEAMMLRCHKKYLPLSALSVTTVGNTEWYELFGAMSSRSLLKNIITELRTLAYNAVELSSELGPSAHKTSETKGN